MANGTVPAKSMLEKPATQADIDAIWKYMQTQNVERLKDKMELIHIRIIEMPLQQSNRIAVEFVNNQFFARLALAQFVTGALLLASNEYNGILGVKDAQKGLDLLSLALIAIPGLGTVAGTIKKWSADDSTAIKKFIAHIGSNLNDIYGATLAGRSDADKTSLNQSDASNKIIQEALSDVYRQIGLALMLHTFASRYVIEKSLTEYQLINEWKRNGLSILPTSIMGALWATATNEHLKKMAKTFLYDMLRAYAQKYCKVKLKGTSSLDPRAWSANRAIFESNITGKELHETLPQNLSTVGEFVGMSQGSRYQIYERFGDSWNGVDPKRPPIRSYRDMIKPAPFWEVRIEK